LDVDVAEPLVDVSVVFLFDVFEFVRCEVYIAIEERHFKFALVYLKFAVDDWESAPAFDDVLGRVLGAEVDELEDDHMGWFEIHVGWQHIVELVAFEVELAFLWLVFDHIGIDFAEIDPDSFSVRTFVQVLEVLIIESDLGVAHGICDKA